jgi:lipopolysaccharide/colanic/teichoic acid biosynthesis glycosyltransferase
MSLVGPRPPIPYETASYQAWHLRRILTVRPGITGLWQVEGRSRVTFNEMVRMDIRYICAQSLAADLKILLKTVRVVLRCEGAA